MYNMSILDEYEDISKSENSIQFNILCFTQGGKGNSEGKKVQQSQTSKLSIGMFM